MARIVELSYPQNVSLRRGAMQNWRDLEFERPSASAAGASFLPGSVGRVLVVGPHDPSFVRQLSESSVDLTVVTRAIPDAAEIGVAAPRARVLAAGIDEVGGPFDLIMALDDLSLIQSAERPNDSWAQLADRLVRLLTPEGELVLGIENERGLHRGSGADDPYLRNRDSDWTPFATWDSSRPRTHGQVSAWTAGLCGGSSVVEVFGTWASPSALAYGAVGSDVAALWMGRSPATSVLALRSAALADRVGDHVAGWVVHVGNSAAPSPRDHQSGLLWTEAGPWNMEDRTAHLPGSQTIIVPKFGRTPLVELVELAADSDTPGMRALLQTWYAWIKSAAADGLVPAELADARFGNLVRVTDRFAPLAPATAALRVEEVAWVALSDLLGIFMNQGLRHPWPAAMHWETRLAALGAMAGAPRPTDLAHFLPMKRDAGQGRAELLAVTRRQQEELQATWARLRWDEKAYASWRAINLGKRAVRYAQKHGRNVPKTAARRAISSVRRRVG